MSEQSYLAALKLGNREYRSCVQKGQYPYLPVLDDILPKPMTLSSVSLGLVHLPVDSIVGTKTAGRTTAFARNFMPLLERHTEFAIKWAALSEAHETEGIRDPIKVFEYMNRFYVQEGNKRVSVLKFYGAVSIPAYVTRILPAQNGELETDIYYEFVAFYRLAPINDIWFSKLGGFERLQTLVGKTADEKWSEDDVLSFRSFYYYFRQAFIALGGVGLPIYAGDALLEFLSLYGYRETRRESPDSIRQLLSKLWQEIVLLGKETPVAVKLDPSEAAAPKKGLLTMLKGGHQTLRAAFIYDKTIHTSGWTYSHELGRMHVQNVFQDRIKTTCYENALENDADAVLEQAIADGNTVIFCTTPRMLNASLRAAVNHPEITILNCSPNVSRRSVRTYYARMYEAKFIIGAVAASLCESGRIGYVCDYPIYGMIAGINAFAEGARMINPRAKIYLEWSCVDGQSGALQKLRDRGLDLISALDMIQLDKMGRCSFGLCQVSSDGELNLAMPVWHWGVFYERTIRSLLDNSFRDASEARGQALNYYWGMSSGLVDVLWSDSLPQPTQELVKLLRSAIQSGSYQLFSGIQRTQNGASFGGSDSPLTAQQILSMDWLTDNVIGSIPPYQALGSDAQSTVDIVGVKTASEPAKETPIPKAAD